LLLVAEVVVMQMVDLVVVPVVLTLVLDQVDLVE
jgi:hypothetical protein